MRLLVALILAVIAVASGIGVVACVVAALSGLSAGTLTWLAFAVYFVVGWLLIICTFFFGAIALGVAADI